MASASDSAQVVSSYAISSLHHENRFGHGCPWHCGPMRGLSYIDVNNGATIGTLMHKLKTALRVIIWSGQMMSFQFAKRAFIAYPC